MSPYTVLVAGATGKQGSATVAQLCALPGSQSELRILALTRDTSSDAALALAEKYKQVELVQGDFDHIGALFDHLPATPDALFSVQASLGAYKGYTPQREIEQGRSLHEAAIDIGVKHIVYTSVDRHGTDSDVRATKVPHFDSKMEIEQHLQAECAKHAPRTSWTILRPATFFDNLTPDLTGRVVAATVGRCPRPQQMVAVRDVGWFAARALTGFDGKRYPWSPEDQDLSLSTSKAVTNVGGNRGSAQQTRKTSSPYSSPTTQEKEEKEVPGAESLSSPGEQVAIVAPRPNPYAGRKISLAGDEMTLAGMRERFYEKMGYPLPEAYGWLGGGALWMSRDLAAMYDWLGRVGYAADIPALRREHPGLLRFGDWVQRESGFTRGGEVLGSWLN